MTQDAMKIRIYNISGPKAEVDFIHQTIFRLADKMGIGRLASGGLPVKVFITALGLECPEDAGIIVRLNRFKEPRWEEQSLSLYVTEEPEGSSILYDTMRGILPHCSFVRGTMMKKK